jgi:hypothetical protein
MVRQPDLAIFLMIHHYVSREKGLTDFPSIGFVIAQVTPGPIVMARKAALRTGRSASQNETLDAPQVVFTPSSSLRCSTKVNRVAHATGTVPIGIARGRQSRRLWAVRGTR